MRIVKLHRLAVALLVVVGLAACGGAKPAAQATPAASLGGVKLNAHPASLEGKTVVLRWNGKPNGDKFLNLVAEQLAQRVKGVKVVKMWEVDSSTATSSDSAEASAQLADKIAAQKPDLVIASQCD